MSAPLVVYLDTIIIRLIDDAVHSERAFGDGQELPTYRTVGPFAASDFLTREPVFLNDISRAYYLKYVFNAK